MNHEVDLVINCYEKNYKRVLDSNFIKEKVNQNKFPFKNTFIVINNVNNKNNVRDIAEKLKKEGIIGGYFRVEEHIKQSLQTCHLETNEISKLLNYTNRALVCSKIVKSEYFVHRDPDVSLKNSIDRISPSIKEMKRNENILIANPLREEYNKEGVFWFKETNLFYYSYGFSDQLYLVKKTDMLQDIYRYDHIYTSRFPLYPIDKTFEARIDAYMRKKGKVRLVYKQTTYIHELGKGTPYPKYTTIQYFKRISMFIVRKIFCKLWYNHVSNTYKNLFR